MFHLMKWNVSQLFPQSLSNHCISISGRQGTIVDKDFVAGLVFFSFQSMKSQFLCQRCGIIDVRLSISIYSTSLFLIIFIGVAYSSGIFLFTLCRAAYILGSSLDCWRISVGQQLNQMRPNPCTGSFGDKRYPVGTPTLFDIIQIALVYVYSLVSLYCINFPFLQANAL